MTRALVLLLAGGLANAAASPPPQAERPAAVTSPDGSITVEASLGASAGASRVFRYRVERRGVALVEDSELAIEFLGEPTFRDRLRVVRVDEREADSTYTLVVGKTSRARDHYREATVVLEEEREPRRRVEVIFRAYDDGVAFRYRFPEQEALAEFTISEERTQFRLPEACRAYALPLGGFTTSYETYYKLTELAALEPDLLIGLPLLLEHPAGLWVALTEANLTDYAGMYVARVAAPSADSAPGEASPAGTATLISRLSPMPDRPEVKVRASAPHVSPWRVLLIADDPGRLIESDLIVNLNEPCAIADTDWIRPGKTAFPWWNGYVTEGAGFDGDLDTRTMKHYIDFCAEHGIEYHSLDGINDRAWYGGPIRPRGKTDITTAVPEIDLAEVRRYAAEKGVRLRFWMHWLALAPQIDQAFPLYQEWGIEGIMVDFMDRDDQEMVRFYHDVVRKAARHHLTVNFHGAYKPTGIRRTWPNLLTREGVLNLEYNKFDGSRGSTPGHELLVPFTRMLAGPLDYHQGGFRHVLEAGFAPQYTAPLVMGTRARALATYVVFENHLPMVADYPAAYAGQTGIEFVAGVPVSWDETRVLQASVGESIAVARRKGSTWYVGSMTDSDARELELPLRFLASGDFVAEAWADDPAAAAIPASVIHRASLVTAADTYAITMARAGGHVLRLSPAPEGTKLPRYPEQAAVRR